MTDNGDYFDSPAVSSWRPIETAPTDGTSVLVYEKGTIYMCWYNIARNQWRDDRGVPIFAATHWMAVPEPPVKKSS